MQPDPSSTEQNLTKADEEFLTHQSRFSELTPLKILNITCVPLSIYQIATGLFYSSTYPSLLNISLSSSGFLSLILTLFGLKWLRSTLKEGEKEIAPFSKKRESFSTIAFLVSTILKLAASPLMLINLSLQKNQMRDYLTASDEAQFGTSQAMTVFFILAEVILFFYAIFSLAVTLKFAKRPRKIHSNFIYLANVALLGASLALAFNANRIYNTSNYPRLESLFPAWNLKSILLFGSLTAGLSVPVWLINYRKWRIGFFSLAAILGSLGLLLLLFNGFAYSHANRIYNEYSNTENLKDLKGRMSYVSEQELINYGCPAKYLPQDNCDNRLLVNAWETNAQSSQEYCLNINCAGVLGQLYSERYLQLANWGLLASIASILIAGSLLYSSIYRQAFSHERRSRKNLSWLGLLFTMGLACVLTYGFSSVRDIQEYDLKNEFGATQDSIPVMKAWDYVNYDNSEEGNYLDLRIPTPDIQAPNVTIGDVENAAHSAFDGLKEYIENVDKSIEENKDANQEDLPPEDKQIRDTTLEDIGKLARTAAGDLVAPIWPGSSNDDQETYLNR